MRRLWLRELHGATSPEPRCGVATIAAARTVLGPAAAAWGIQIASGAARTALGGTNHREVPATLLEPVRRSSEACVLAVMCGLYDDVAAADMVTPVEAVDSARDAVHAGLPLERLLLTMWKAHVSTVDALLEELPQALGRPDLQDEARAVRNLSFAYLDTFSEAIVGRYGAERDAWVGTVSAARRDMVAAVLARRPLDTAHAERTLGLRLSGPLTAAVVWSDQPGSVPDHELLALVSALARAAGAGNPLTVHGIPKVLWTWLPLRSRPRGSADLAARLRDTVTPPPELRVALGPPGTGLEGFRRSHLAALRAQVLAPVVTSWLVEYREVAVLSLLTAEAEEAGWFAQDTLGALAADDDRAVLLQETLHAYLATGRSRAAAADRLHVATGTVAYRVRQAEALLGRPVDGIDRDVALALDVLRVRRATVRPVAGYRHPRRDEGPGAG